MSTSNFPDASSNSRLIETVVDKYADDLLELRRDLHAHPELSWAEHRTTDVVTARMSEAGWRVMRGSRDRRGRRAG